MKFHHLAWITTVVIGIQMVLAGIIVGEDAGLVCPSWPVCSNSGPIPITGSLIFEMVHRGVALLLGVLVIWLLVWLFKSYKKNRAMIWTCCLGLVSLLIQIVYAGLIVIFVFPGIASTVDVMNSMIMLSLFIHLANLAQRDYQLKQGTVTEAPDAQSRALKPAAWLVYGAGMIAVFAGAVFRHTGASQALFGEDSYIASHNQTNPPSLGTSHLLLGIHVTTAALLVMAGIWFIVGAYKHQRMMQTAGLIMALILIQGILGVASLTTQLQLFVVTAHWAMAGLIMGVVAYAVSRSYLATEAEGRHQFATTKPQHV